MICCCGDCVKQIDIFPRSLKNKHLEWYIKYIWEICPLMHQTDALDKVNK